MGDHELNLERARGRARGFARGQIEESSESASLGRGHLGQRPMMTSTTDNNTPPGVGGSGSDPNSGGRGIRRGMERGRASGSALTDRFEELKLRVPVKQETIAPSRIFHNEVLFDQVETLDDNCKLGDAKHAKDSNSKIQLQTNVLFLQNRPNWKLYSYSIEFRPELDDRKKKKRVLRQHDDNIFEGANTYIFDGTKIWTRHELNNGAEVIKGASSLKDRHASEEDEGETIKFRMKLIGAHSSVDPIALQVYNLHFKRYQEMLEMKEINRDFYFPDLAQPIQSQGHKFQIWPGLIARINRFERVDVVSGEKIYTDHPGLLVDTKSKVVRQETCYDVIKGLSKKFSKDELVKELKRNLVGSTVVTSYGKQDNYRVEDITWEESPQSTFECRGKEISYLEYYEKQYNLKIKDKKQPLFACKPKKRMPGQKGNQSIYLIPELCSPTGLTDSMRMDFKIMRDLATLTRKTPEQRFVEYEKIRQQFMKNVQVKEMMGVWGLRFDKAGFAKADGVKLKPQDVFMNNKKISGTDKADWDRDLKMNTLLKPPEPMKKWVFIGNKKSEKTAIEFQKCIKKCCQQLGWKVDDSKLILSKSDREVPNHAQEWMDKGVELALCFVQRESKTVYDAVKKRALTNGIATQFVKERTIAKNMQAVALKVALQMACKMGGEPWKCKMPPGGKIKDRDCMFVGVDVYHDTVKKSESVYAMVSSLNGEVTRWYSTFQVLGQTEEVGAAIRTMILQCCNAYKNRNGWYPGQIYIYRDGVGDTDLARVKMIEVDMICAALEDLKKAHDLPQSINMTFAVIKKRIDHKFLAIKKVGKTEKLDNPPPGTVCDTVLTKKIWYDFFLVSQMVRQGTVTPIHINIIHDTFALAVDKVQELTFRLTHLYYNWPGTVRVPAPVQYAHKLAALIGDNVHSGVEVMESMKDKLYFL